MLKKYICTDQHIPTDWGSSW